MSEEILLYTWYDVSEQEICAKGFKNSTGVRGGEHVNKSVD